MTRRGFTPRGAVNEAARAVARASGWHVGDSVDLVSAAEAGVEHALRFALLGEAAARALLGGEAGEEGWVLQVVREADAERSARVPSSRAQIGRPASSWGPCAGCGAVATDHPNASGCQEWHATLSGSAPASADQVPCPKCRAGEFETCACPARVALAAAEFDQGAGSALRGASPTSPGRTVAWDRCRRAALRVLGAAKAPRDVPARGPLPDARVLALREALDAATDAPWPPPSWTPTEGQDEASAILSQLEAAGRERGLALRGAPASRAAPPHADLEDCPAWYDGCHCGSLHVALVNCSARKAEGEHARPARDLYVGDLFRASVSLVEARGQEWAVVSAGRGLVLADQLVYPYDARLDVLDRVGRARWAARVADAAVGRWPGRAFEVYAGATYADPLVAALRARGAEARGAYEDLRAARLARDPGARWGVGAIREELARALAEEQAGQGAAIRARFRQADRAEEVSAAHASHGDPTDAEVCYVLQCAREDDLDLDGDALAALLTRFVRARRAGGVARWRCAAWCDAREAPLPGTGGISLGARERRPRQWGGEGEYDAVLVELEVLAPSEDDAREAVEARLRGLHEHVQAQRAEVRP